MCFAACVPIAGEPLTDGACAAQTPRTAPAVLGYCVHANRRTRTSSRLVIRPVTRRWLLRRQRTQAVGYIAQQTFKRHQPVAHIVATIWTARQELVDGVRVV